MLVDEKVGVNRKFFGKMNKKQIRFQLVGD